MADIELVVKIPEKTINEIKDNVMFAGSISSDIRWDVTDAIVNAISLPKEHGRLSDMDELIKNIVKEYGVNSIHELPQDLKMFYDKFINSAPTILDATVDYKLKNYAFF